MVHKDFVYPALMFKLENVSKAHGPVRVLDAVNLQIEAGATTALIGPSGAGKSTILRLLLGLDWPDQGWVLYEGQPLARDTLLHRRQRMGYVIQEGGLFPHLNAADNASLLARTLGWQSDRIEARLRELAALCQLRFELLSRFPAELSGGQRQRVGLVRALMLDPPALLLDEPLGALDPIVRHDLQTEMHDLFATLGKTVVLVTHDVAEAAYLGRHLVLLRKGKIVQQGTAQALLEQPAEPFVRDFMTAQRSLQVNP